MSDNIRPIRINVEEITRALIQRLIKGKNNQRIERTTTNELEVLEERTFTPDEQKELVKEVLSRLVDDPPRDLHLYKPTHPITAFEALLKVQATLHEGGHIHHMV